MTTPNTTPVDPAVTSPANPPADPPANPPAPVDPPVDPAKAEESKDPPALVDPPEIVYDLKLPENAVVDASAAERTTAIVRELGLSPEAAQKMFELLNSEVASFRDATLASHQPGGAEWEKQEAAWRAAAAKDPVLMEGTFEKNTELAKRVFATFFDEEAQEFIEKTGLGSNPAVLRGLVRIGRKMEESSLVLPKLHEGAPKKTDTELFYPSNVGQ